MILYHFCSAHMVESIKVNGLIRGKFPMLGDGHVNFLDNHQWLTDDKDPKNQSWATSVLIPYSRTEYRLTIEIPASYRKKLHRALEYIKAFPPTSQGLITDWPGHEHWYIFKGRVLPEWIIGCRKVEA